MFSKMKKAKTNIKELADKLSTADHSDERFWEYKADDKGNYYGEIRFLPTIEGEDSPMILLYRHFYKSSIGRWYVNNCPTTLGVGNDCPVCEANTEYLKQFGGWDSADNSAKEFVRNRKRDQNFIANIYVVKDPANPENEGKVFLFKFGVKIHNKIMNAIKPKFADEKAIDPFNFWSGATFKLKVSKVDGQTTYDNCEFHDPAPLLDDDTVLERIYNSQYSLTDLISKDKFKPIEKLRAEFNRAEGVKLNVDDTQPVLTDNVTEIKSKSEPESEEMSSIVDEEIEDAEAETLAFFDDLK